MGTTADKLEYLDGTKSAIKQAIVNKGVDVPDGTTFRAYAEKIGSIVKVPSLSNPGSASDLRSGKQLAGADGSVITGTLAEVTQATPSISVSSSGLITASVTQSGGIVPGGSKSATQQLTTQGAKTVTPGTSNQTAVASGRYTTGDVVVSGDANLVPENIAEGVSIFGVTGTHSGGGGVQTVTGTFACGIKGGATFSYTDGDGVYQEVSRVTDQISVSAVMNSLVLVKASFLLGMFSISGATLLQGSDGSGNFRVYRIDQDGFSFS